MYFVLSIGSEPLYAIHIETVNAKQVSRYKSKSDLTVILFVDV